MNKEYIEAFGRITLHTEYDNDSSYDGLHFEDDCKLIDNALNRLEAIENVKPSEALYELKRIDYNITYLLSDCDTNEEVSMCLNSLRDNKSCEVIKAALLKAQAEHKALEIIFKKKVDIDFLKSADTFNEYNKLIKFKSLFAIPLTEEEFDLLKEVLE